MRIHPHLYEINTWVWLEQLSARAGRFISLENVPDSEWDRLAELGFDIVWLMGVWQRSSASRRIMMADPANRATYDRVLPGWQDSDIIGSPYAVAQYVPDPRVGTWSSLDSVREKLRARGIALFLDFVGNHTALDAPWTLDHPEFYVQGTQQDFDRDPGCFHHIDTARGPVFIALGRDPYIPPWKDVAQLNYFLPQLRAAQIESLRTISAHCDGVRCDMAMLQLTDIFAKIWGHLLRGAAPPEKEFWAEAHAALPELALLAEAYWGTESRLIDLGFSFVYNKEMYDAVRDVHPQDIQRLLTRDANYQSHLARFLDNHDEQACARVFGKERLSGVGTLIGTLPGMRFYYQGELEGWSEYLPITLRMGVDRPADQVTQAFFEKIIRISNEEVFHQGNWRLLPVAPERDDTSQNLIVYEWRSDKSWKVIAVNLAGYASQGYVHFIDQLFPSPDYVFYDELDGTRYERKGDQLRQAGLFVRREAFQAHLFSITPL